MRPLLFFLWAVLFLGVGGCGKKSESTHASNADKGSIASELPPADVRAKKAQGIIESAAPTPPVEGIYVTPYLDSKGKLTELAVKPGEEFSIYIFAETVDPYQTSAVQYRLDMPDGIRVLGVDEMPQKGVSIGDYRQNYMLAYDCQPAGHFRLATYRCVAQPDFRGGQVVVRDGMQTSGISFLGFTTCDYVEIRATGGTATLDLKK